MGTGMNIDKSKFTVTIIDTGMVDFFEFRYSITVKPVLEVGYGPVLKGEAFTLWGAKRVARYLASDYLKRQEKQPYRYTLESKDGRWSEEEQQNQ